MSHDREGRRPIDPAQIARFEMLRGVGLAARQELLAAATERVLEPGEVLLRQGAHNDQMYLVVEGELAVHLDTLDGEPIALIGAGETVGELSVLDGSVASAHVVAKGGLCRLLVLDEESFWALTNVSHAFALNLLLKLAERLRRNNATVSQNVQKRQQYERAAMFDGLTGIHNRRWLDETLARMIRRQGRGAREPLSLALIDIDHFKPFNDRFGHDVGDFVLTAVALTLSKNLRPTDLVARYGGEEFVIIFPKTALDLALRAAERVRLAVAEQELSPPSGEAIPGVTISCGVAQLMAGQTSAELLKAADAAMYRAKCAGRNSVLPAPYEAGGGSGPV